MSESSNGDGESSGKRAPKNPESSGALKHCPPEPPSHEPAQDCLWRVRGYDVRKMEWQSYLVRASDNVGALAQGVFRWGGTHKYIHIFGDPILDTPSGYPPVLDDGAPHKK
jgi:hypothetical protein